MASEAAKPSQVESSHGIVVDLNVSIEQSSRGESKIQPILPTVVNVPMSPPPDRVFPCNYCKNVFTSYHALGGHQTAHKKERELAKRSRRWIETNTFTPSCFRYCPYSTSSSNPFLCPLCRSALGVRLESMIHKPSYPWIQSGSGGYRPSHGLRRLYPRPSFNERFNINNGGFAIPDLSNSSRTGSLTSFAANSQANVATNRAASPKDDSEIDLTLRL